MRRIWFALTVFTAGLIFVGTILPAVADKSSAGAAVAQQQQILTRLQMEPDLKNSHIQVDVDDGIAVLEGTVDSEQEKKEAQELAHVDGILGVNNRLQVRAAEK
jgi:osmotically-inducible protein OsmY